MPEARDPAPRRPRSPSAREREEYDLLLLLERLESLVEEMDDLGIATRDEVVARIAGLHSKLEGEA